MAARQEVTFVISARDRTRAVFGAIRSRLKRLRVGIGGLVAGGIFAKLTKDALGFAAAIKGAEERLDVSAETLQGLKILGERLNIPFETLQGVMQRISRNAGQALGGDTRMIEAFAKLGITFRELSGLNTEDLFFAVADAAADTTRSWRETSALLAKVGDTEAVRLRGLLVQGGDALAEGVNKLADADELLSADALTIAAENDAKAAEALRIAQNEFTKAIVALIPVLKAATPFLQQAVEGLRLLNEFRPEGDELPPATQAAGRLLNTLTTDQGENFAFGKQVGAEIFRALEQRNISGTASDPLVRQAAFETAQATKRIADEVHRLGALR